MRNLSLSSLFIFFFLGLASAQPAGFEAGQVWNVYFQDANGWLVSLETSSPDGLAGTATSASFGAPLDAVVASLDAEDLTFLGLTSGDYVGVLMTYPPSIATVNGGSMLLCSLPVADLSQGQAFELRQESNGPRVVAAGSACNASLTDSVEASTATASAWPPALNAGETWQMTVTQGGAEIAAWTLQLNGGQGMALTGSGSGTDNRTLEVEYLSQNAPAPALLNNWVFALSGAGLEPIYCTFPQEKPFSATMMTGSVLYAGATCTVTKQ